MGHIHKFVYGDKEDIIMGSVIIWLSYISLMITGMLIGSTATSAMLFSLALFSRINILTDKKVFPILHAEIVTDEPMEGGGTECTIH